MNHPNISWPIIIVGLVSVLACKSATAQDAPIRRADPFADIVPIDPLNPVHPPPTPNRGEGRPGKYPIDFLQRQLSQALGEDWEITTTASTIAIRSRFQIQAWSRLATFTQTDKEGNATNFENYEIAVAFTPYVEYEKWEKLNAERDRLVHKVKQGVQPDPKRTTNSKTEYFNLWDELDSFHVPAFSSLDPDRLHGIELGGTVLAGWSAYFRSSDHRLAFFLPLATYQKCKAAEAVVKSYFVSYKM